jgi:hypothetical protein
MVVTLGDIDLANPFHGSDAKNICHHAGFHTPVGRESHAFRNASMQANLAADRVAEKLQRRERFREAIEALHRAQQRSDEKPHDATIQLRRKTGTETLADMKRHVGMEHWKTKAHEQFAPVVEYVAIMDGHGRRVCASEHLPDTETHIATFAHWPGIEAGANQIGEEGFDAWTIIPENRNPLREHGKNPTRRVEVRGITPVEADCDMTHKTGITKLIDDCGESGGVQIPRMTGKHERKRRSADQRDHFLLEFLVVRVSEAMKSRNRAVLVKIRHKDACHSQRLSGIEQARGNDSLQR